MTSAGTKQLLFRILRLDRRFIDCGYDAFVVHCYRAGLGREPEAGIARTAPADDTDVYRQRVRYLRAIIGSEEARAAGLASVVRSIPDLLGSRDAAGVADMIGQAFPTEHALMAELDQLMDHVRENSRRQDMIRAAVAGGRA